MSFFYLFSLMLWLRYGCYHHILNLLLLPILWWCSIKIVIVPTWFMVYVKALVSCILSCFSYRTSWVMFSLSNFEKMEKVNLYHILKTGIQSKTILREYLKLCCNNISSPTPRFAYKLFLLPLAHRFCLSHFGWGKWHKILQSVIVNI